MKCYDITVKEGRGFMRTMTTRVYANTIYEAMRFVSDEPGDSREWEVVKPNHEPPQSWHFVGVVESDERLP